mmetsp:Transcript_4345/g.9808  ORF Transcript_4345/g.9808 Transcript_4345/m.9808 type:complete len:109 (+) Transcript_4345:659-985(+)
MIAAGLAAAVKCLPPAARDALRSSTPNNVDRSQKYGPKCASIAAKDMCCHPDESWLKGNGMSGKKAGCVDMYQISDYPRDRSLLGRRCRLIAQTNPCASSQIPPGRIR